MSEIKYPFFQTSQGAFPPDQSSPHSAWVIFATRALSLKHENLKDLHWSWNLGDYVKESHPDRIQQFYAGLHGSLSNHEFSERTYCVRYLQRSKSCPLKNLFLVRVDGNPNIIDKIAEQSWQEVSATFPYDYILNPIKSESEFAEETGQPWLERDIEQLSIVNFQPAIGTINGFQESNKHTVPVPGFWNATTTSTENIWRALNNYPHPVLLDVLLKPTFLSGNELANFDLIFSHLQKLISENENHPVIKIQAQQWLDSYSQRIRNFAPLYLVQIRLVSPRTIHPYLTRVVGNALTYKSISDQNEPFQSYLTHSSDSLTVFDWAQKIASLELINVDLSFQPYIKKLAMVVSVAELPFVAPFFLIPKGGISNLQLETL